MKSQGIRQIILVGPLLVLAGLLSSCSALLATIEPSPVAPDLGTHVAQTVAAEMTQVAEQATPTPEPTMVPPTATPTARPTNTPIPTPTAPPPPCDHALFIKDVRVADGTEIAPGESFQKVWRLKNIGACTWTPEYALVFAGGDRLDTNRVIPLREYVIPGETVDVSAALTAPEKQGSYRGYWLLRNARGLLFGLGDQADASFWVDIKVTEPERELFYDFARHYCDANWQSGAGFVGCETKRSEERGFVLYQDDPRLENRQENEPALWVHPDHHSSGWIEGTYPAIRIQDGDRFRAWVGCMDGNTGCRVDFHLDYQRASGGPIRNLGTWREAFEGEVTVIDLDLSDLAGKKVRLILRVEVENNKPAKANAFWFVPRIDRVVD